MKVGNPLEKTTTLLNTIELILAKSHMSVANVENVLTRGLVFLSTRGFTLEKDLMSVVNMGNIFAAYPTLNTREFTVEKIFKCAKDVLFPHSV